MSRLGVACGCAAVAAVSMIALVGTARGWWQGEATGGPAPTVPLSLQTSLAPNPAAFGDPVEARVTVGYDATVVSSTSIQIATSFGPYTETRPPTVTRTRHASTGSVVYDYHLQCLSNGCLPAGAARSVEFGLVTLRARTTTGATHQVERWPRLLVTSRLAPGVSTSGALGFRRAASVLPASYAVAPGPLADGLTVAAVLLGLGGLALIGYEIRRVQNRRRLAAEARRSPREIAIALAREAAGRDEAARRKALGLLAEALADEGESTLAATAGDAAWSEEPPSSTRTLEVVAAAEGEEKGREQ